MKPTLAPGTHILVSFVPYFFIRPKIGDIIVANHPKLDLTVVKRIVAINNGVVILAGDFHNASKISVSIDNIKGRVIGTINE